MSDCIVKNLREHPARESFFDLARLVFDLDFAPWHAQGYWTDRYIPYALVRDGQVIANASANLIDTQLDGVPRRFIQIGTVMTHPAYRGQGLMRRLLQALIDDWKPRCDAIYLYANDSVLDFYPRFGFERAQESVFSAPLSSMPGDFAPLDMNLPESVDLLRQLYRQGNPYSALPMLHNFGLLLFYCGFFMKENVFYSPRRRTVCVAGQESDALHVLDVFGTPTGSLLQLCAELAAPDTRQVSLGFTPLNPDGFSFAPLIEEDTTLFVLKGLENPFISSPNRMPALSHA
jgi:GNAT superfamily N-acetyltransferase